MIDSYDFVIVAFSGGKDSWATVKFLQEAGVPHSKMELWHHLVDGREGSSLMEWPCTPSYVEASARSLNMPLFYSWRVGGFEREMNRRESPTAAVKFERFTNAGHVELAQSGGHSNKQGTRLKFPQQSSNLSVRWCSAYLKIDVMATAIRNQKRFLGKKTLVVTGERRQESVGRSRYSEFERHRTHTKSRHVDHWRPIIDYSLDDVWAVMREYRINPHPAYRLGWGRLSCFKCIFISPSQWATANQIDPRGVAAIASYERSFGYTIDRNKDVYEKMVGAAVFDISEADVRAAMSTSWGEPIIVDKWTMPSGAFASQHGPT